MTAAAPKDDTDDKPLDPAVERVRRKLVRFVAINLGILFAALMAVLIAIVYRSATVPEGADAPRFAPPTGEGQVLQGAIALPAGARVMSHSATGDRLTLQVEDAQGAQSIEVFDMATGRIVARFAVTQGQ